MHTYTPDSQNGPGTCPQQHNFAPQAFLSPIKYASDCQGWQYLTDDEGLLPRLHDCILSPTKDHAVGPLHQQISSLPANVSMAAQFTTDGGLMSASSSPCQTCEMEGVMLNESPWAYEARTKGTPQAEHPIPSIPEAARPLQQVTGLASGNGRPGCDRESERQQTEYIADNVVLTILKARKE